MKTIKIHEDNSPLERMNATDALLRLIRRVRDGELDLDDGRMVAAAARAVNATPEDLVNLARFFDECNDAFEMIDVPTTN